MQDRVQRVILWFYGHFVHDGVKYIYRKGFTKARGANAAAAVRRTTANPLCKKSKPSNKWSSNR
jgi:hypothetical protein